jgi:hypothetical protein
MNEKITYREIEVALKNRKPFDGFSMKGVNQGNTYVVYSYKTPIYREENGRVVMFNMKYISRTTRKHQNIVRSVLFI